MHITLPSAFMEQCPSFFIVEGSAVKPDVVNGAPLLKVTG
jgi:hypothetical protein